MNWQQRWALRSTRTNWPTSWLVACAFALVAGTAAIDWGDASVRTGVIFGYFAMMIVDLAKSRALRRIIDEQCADQSVQPDSLIERAQPAGPIRRIVLSVGGVIMICSAALASWFRLTHR